MLHEVHISTYLIRFVKIIIVFNILLFSIFFACFQKVIKYIRDILAKFPLQFNTKYSEKQQQTHVTQIKARISAHIWFVSKRKRSIIILVIIFFIIITHTYALVGGYVISQPANMH